ncbi:hypothetical protein [Halomonas stenophila]|uniref:Uncharacterized protein n=1 Tax=Halomonas stenophila TaxID=795312 RepID=A0A7W5EW55_9GAMM|nr:hypothetical protein [Halomonas stenophila]MBB3231900.1 hypothetical protein [Halomonas stenophila]
MPWLSSCDGSRTKYERLRFVPLVECELGLLRPGRRSLSPAVQAMEAFVVESLRPDAAAGR